MVMGFLVSVMDVQPALGKGFAGAKDQLGLLELLGVLQLLARVIASDDIRVHGVKEVDQAKDLNQLVIVFVLQEHDVSPVCFGTSILCLQYGPPDADFKQPKGLNRLGPTIARA
jgi:hypothetical protein